jgi:hypothetical protein
LKTRQVLVPKETIIAKIMDEPNFFYGKTTNFLRRKTAYPRRMAQYVHFSPIAARGGYYAILYFYSIL